MKAKDIMTTDVLTVSPDTKVIDIAKLLLERRISAVPVVEGDRIVGLVSEGDLVHRSEIGTDRRAGSRWLRLFTGESPEEFVKTHGLYAGNIMTPDVITVTEDTPISEIADIFESRRIKRVPVISDGRLVGIVSRADLVQALAASGAGAIDPVDMADETIQARLQATLDKQSWWSTMASTITVTDGVVHYWGLSVWPDEYDAARIAAEAIMGVREVKDHRAFFDGRLTEI